MDEHPLPAVEVSAEGSTVILCVNGTEMCCPAMFNIKIPAPVNTKRWYPTSAREQLSAPVSHTRVHLQHGISPSHFPSDCHEIRYFSFHLLYS